MPVSRANGASDEGPSVPGDSGMPVLQGVGLVKHFTVHRSGRGGSVGPRRVVHAVDGVSLSLYSGEVTALVGESGSGKSTLARLLAQLLPLTSGTIKLDGAPVRAVRGRAYRRYSSRVQMVFQDPFSSLNPIHTVGYQLQRPLSTHGTARSRADRSSAVANLLREVNLSPPSQYSRKFPHELSGGQLQRVAIARTLAARPSVLLADEPVSMLDVSIRLGVLNLLDRLVRERQLALLYVTHDMGSARYFAKTALVMYAGQLIEGGTSEALTQDPAHPYTQLLLSSAPDPDRERTRDRMKNRGEPPSLITPPTGCRFHPRCPHAMPICGQAAPPRTDLGPERWVNCWLHVDGRRRPGEVPVSPAELS